MNVLCICKAIVDIFFKIKAYILLSSVVCTSTKTPFMSRSACRKPKKFRIVTYVIDSKRNKSKNMLVSEVSCRC